VKNATLLISLFLSTALGAQEHPKETPRAAEAEADKKRAEVDRKRAQEEALRPRPGETMRLFEIKHADVNKLCSLLALFARTSCNGDLRVVAVAGSPEVIAAVEDAVKRLDVLPPTRKNIELTLQFVRASDQPSTSPELPADLQGVVKQLRALSPYKSFGLLDTVVTRGRDGQRDGTASGVLPGRSDEKGSIEYFIAYGLTSIASDDKGRMVRIDRLKLRFIPHGINPGASNLGIETDIDLREGQKTVIGKSSIDTTGAAMVVVLSVKVLD